MSDPSVQDARDSLARVLASEEFTATPKLQEFLGWVVDQWLAGRANSISGKAIAVEVYGRDAADDESGLNLVRVEARRLRRRLDRYYDGQGGDDPWQIRIDKGGYAPRFEPRRNGTGGEPSPSTRRVPWVPLAASFIVLAGVILLLEQQIRHVEAPESRAAAAERAAIGSRSMVSLQAVNLATQARNLLFPVFDIKQQELALSMYRHVIDLDPGLHHGYSGAAQVLGVLAFLEADQEKSALLVDEAMQMAIAGIDRAPTNPWAISAKAWVLSIAGAMPEAMEQARLAAEIAPTDGYVLDLVGITAIVSGDGSFAAEVSHPGRERSGVARFGANNVWGVSQYMTGNYANAIEAFSGAAEAGASISAPSLVFLAVACDHAGRSDEAAEAVRELQDSWPTFPLEFVVGRMFVQQPAHRDDILDRIRKYGYQARR